MYTIVPTNRHHNHPTTVYDPFFSPMANFAETFMLFVKHKGKLPAQFKGKPAIMKKWKAVAEIVKRVAAATR